jgi:hypothetical protein
MIKFSVESDVMNEYVVPHTQEKNCVERRRAYFTNPFSRS